jgi:hypothetical protein
MNPKTLLIASAAILIVACAGVQREDGAQSPLERYMAAAGAPIDRFSYAQRLRGWHPVDREHLFVRTGTNEAYLLTVAAGCDGLKTTHRIGITSRAGRAIATSGLDAIQLERDECRITEIRPLDLAALEASEAR